MLCLLMKLLLIFNSYQDEKNRLCEMTGLTKNKLDRWFQKKRTTSGQLFTKTRSHLGQSLSKRFPELVQQFQNNPNPTESEKLHLMENTGLSETQIRKYFNRQRRKHNL